MNLTINQQLAVDIRNKNILVSAAAGSGKTAVLVKRIIDRILDSESPVDIDRILVMTFTKAAAAQMKDRILKAIEEKRAKDPFNKNLQRQASLVHTANITTIDSFCMMVVRNHFSEIDLNPDFRIADEGECNLIKRDALGEVLEEMFESSDENFLMMTETFATGKSDDALEELVLRLHTFSESYPNPEDWLNNCCSKYGSIDVEILDSEEWIIEFVNSTKKQLKEISAGLNKALDLCYLEYGPIAYAEALQSDIDYIDGIVLKDKFSEIYDYVQSYGVYSPKTLGTYRLPKEGTVSATEIKTRTELKDKVKAVRDKSKEIIKGISETIADNSPEDTCSSMMAMYPTVQALVDVTLKFKSRFNKKKREKNVVDFNDLEHMCLEILRSSDDIAGDYRNAFVEIYVDEYQDSNLVQEEIVKKLTRESDDSGNLFMVGDVKQSIYGFRLARPDIFIEKYNRFPSEMSESPDLKIDLHDNFRSRKTVIDSVNEIFEKIMTEDSGKLVYDDNAALHAMADYCDGDGYETEFVYGLRDEDFEDKELEARIVANRIREIVGHLDIKDGDDIRKAKCSDIVILLRTAKGWDNVFMNTLQSEGIPVHVTSTEGYFSQREVSTLLEYLKIIDNPLQDIPLMASMRSVFGDFSDEEVAKIRGAYPEGRLYDSMNHYYETYVTDPKCAKIVQKIQKFKEDLTYFRNKMIYTPVDRIIAEIIDGFYGQCVKAEHNGEKKFANLNVLLSKAEDYGRTSYKGLFHFNRYIEMLHKYEIDFGEANILDENDDAVRIMSIHKSKGLEFPVCFLCGMNKKFNMQDSRASVISDADWGIGVDIIDPVRRTKRSSLFKKSLALKKYNEALEEEIRLFYVAMTRAKEKLIMSSVIKEDNIQEANVMLSKASSYLDLYLYAKGINAIKSIYDRKILVEDLVSNKVDDAINEEIKREKINKLINIKIEHLPEEIENRFRFIYPYEDDKNTTKLSVSEIKRRSMAIHDTDALDDLENEKQLYEEKLPDKIVYSNKKELSEDYSPALRGTAIHKAFEVWDYSRPTKMTNIEEFIKKIDDEKLVQSDLLKYIDKFVIYYFVNSDIARRMKEAYDNGSLRREQPFVIEDETEGCLVQGIIDAYFIEDDEIVVVDYKTDRLDEKVEFVDKYKIQLDYYANALERVLEKKVKEKVIYSTYLKECITM